MHVFWVTIETSLSENNETLVIKNAGSRQWEKGLLNYEHIVSLIDTNCAEPQ